MSRDRHRTCGVRVWPNPFLQEQAWQRGASWCPVRWRDTVPAIPLTVTDISVACAFSRQVMQTLADRHVSKNHIERILYLPEPDRVDDIQGTHDDSKAADQYGNAVCPGERTEQQQKTENGKDQTDKKDEHPALAPQAQRYCAQHLDHAGEEQPAADEEWQRDKGEQGIEQEKDTEKKVQDTFGLKPVAFPGAHGAYDDHREQQTAVQQKAHAGKLGELHIAAQRIEEGEDTDTQDDNTGYEYQAPGSNVFGRGSHRAIYG